MKKVFALLTIVSVISLVACKNTPKVDASADSARVADSLEQIRIADSTAQANEAAAQAANDTTNKDTAAKAE